MAVVVIGTMVGFIGGSYITRLGRTRSGKHVTVALFDDNKKITNYDITIARQELEILNILQAGNILRNLGTPILRLPDLHAAFLAELLFSERKTSPPLTRQIKQFIRANNYRISDKQINDIYRRNLTSDIYWLLLNKEAQLAGIRVSNKNSGRLLASIIPQLFNGATYEQVIGSIVNRHGITEQEILTTYGKLTAVLNYARTICAGDDITKSQIMHNASWENETIDVELVKFDSDVFTDSQDQPTEEQISAHFEKYKDYLPATVSDDNPYAFGYKLPDRVQLEYIAVKLDDIAKTVTEPTQQETEEYYQKYRQQLFTEQVPSDPNDPNSLPTERTKSYAEVAGIITKRLFLDSINSKAEKILQEAKTLAEAGFEDLETQLTNLPPDQLEKIAGNYLSIAQQLTDKYKINLYAGKTGLLSATDMKTDKHLATLYLQGYAYNPVDLAQIVFAVEQLNASELGPFDVPKPRLYENIGPLKDITGQITGKIQEKLMALVRITDAQKASQPQNLNQTLNITAITLDQQQSQDLYSVKENVTQDLKRLAAMDTAKTKAQQFIEFANKDGWDTAIEKFNNLYSRKNKQDTNDPNTFKLQKLANLQRIPTMTLETLAVQTSGNPASHLLLDTAKKEALLIEQLYSLIPPDSNSIENLPLIVESKPNMSYYCIKNISVKRLYQQEYQKIKAIHLYNQSLIQSQSLAPVHFNPENIVKRTNFRFIQTENKPSDDDANSQSQGKS
jgi:hypothetical protein